MELLPPSCPGMMQLSLTDHSCLCFDLPLYRTSWQYYRHLDHDLPKLFLKRLSACNSSMVRTMSLKILQRPFCPGRGNHTGCVCFRRYPLTSSWARSSHQGVERRGTCKSRKSIGMPG